VAEKTFGTPLGELSKKALEDHPAFAANPLGDWKDLVGEQVARHSAPKSFKGKVLVVTAHDSIWKHHLELNRQALMDRINAGRPEPLVEKIVVKVGELPEAPPELNPNHKKLQKAAGKPGGQEASKAKSRRRSRKKPKPKRRVLTEEEKALLKNISDKELRQAGRRLLQLIPEDEPPLENQGLED
jgi:hypothetical protein